MKVLEEIKTVFESNKFNGEPVRIILTHNQYKQNAIIHASRLEMIKAVLYLVGTDAVNGEVIDAVICRLCKRMIINAGIVEVLIQERDNHIRREPVKEWIDSNMGEFRDEGGEMIPIMPKKLQTKNHKD